MYVIIAFADVTAGTFVQKASTVDGDAPGPAVATSSILYLGIAIVMGLCMRRFKLGEGKAQLIFLLPLVLAAIIAGPYLPFGLRWTHGQCPAGAVGSRAARLLFLRGPVACVAADAAAWARSAATSST